MSTRAERKERATDDSKLGRMKRGLCPNCGKKGPHFVPPSGGGRDPGFYACEAFAALNDHKT